MFAFSFVFFSFSFLQLTGSAGSHSDSAVTLPPWIADNPAFQHPKEIDSIAAGNGSVSGKGKTTLSWLVHLNDRMGHGIEMQLVKLSLEPDAGDFLLLAPWPVTSAIQAKLFTGVFLKPQRQLRIPNTKSMQLMFSSSKDSSEVTVKYRRYGTSLEEVRPPTDNPVLKETVFEVQLKGKPPSAYSDPQLLTPFKEAVRSAARRFCSAHEIPFNDNTPTQEMVQLHRVSFCPLEWPDRDICTSIEHSVFVSGVRVSGYDLSGDYELSGEHLREMWREEEFPELEELGIGVFKLPEMSSTVTYWSLIIGLMAALSLLGSFFFWKTNYAEEVSPAHGSLGSKETKKERKVKVKLGKQQRIPSFMYEEGSFEEVKQEVLVKEKFEDVLKPGDSDQLPIKSYFGSILFGTNRAFEEDEDSPIEMHSKPTPK